MITIAFRNIQRNLCKKDKGRKEGREEEKKEREKMV